MKPAEPTENDAVNSMPSISKQVNDPFLTHYFVMIRNVKLAVSLCFCASCDMHCTCRFFSSRVKEIAVQTLILVSHFRTTRSICLIFLAKFLKAHCTKKDSNIQGQ